MTDQLTPEAVKAALELATPEPWVVGASEGRVLSHWEGIGYWEIANAVEISFRGDSGVEYSAGGTQEGNAALIAMAPALARDWLRLKKVEEAGNVLVGYAEGMIEDGCPKCGGACSGANPPVSFCPIRTIMSDIAAFRAAVEGK
mgnify:CR=1 FL=1